MKQSEVQFPQEVTNDGVQIVKELMHEWASRTSCDGSGDALMSDDLSPDTQLTELRRCVEDFEPRITNNEWLQTLFASL